MTVCDLIPFVDGNRVVGLAAARAAVLAVKGGLEALAGEQCPFHVGIALPAVAFAGSPSAGTAGLPRFGHATCP